MQINGHQVHSFAYKKLRESKVIRVDDQGRFSFESKKRTQLLALLVRHGYRSNSEIYRVVAGRGDLHLSESP